MSEWLTLHFRTVSGCPGNTLGGTTGGVGAKKNPTGRVQDQRRTAGSRTRSLGVGEMEVRQSNRLMVFTQMMMMMMVMMTMKSEAATAKQVHSFIQSVYSHV